MEENVIVMARKSDLESIKEALATASKEFEKKVGYSVKFTISQERYLPESRYFLQAMTQYMTHSGL